MCTGCEKVKHNAHPCTEPKGELSSAANAIADCSINLQKVAKKVPKADLIRDARARHIWVA